MIHNDSYTMNYYLQKTCNNDVTQLKTVPMSVFVSNWKIVEGIQSTLDACKHMKFNPIYFRCV